MTTSNASLKRWVQDVARLTQPASIHWCNGSEAENAALIEAMLKSGDLIKLNPQTHPNCYLHRSNPSDVARVEHLTYVCTRNKGTPARTTTGWPPMRRTARSTTCSPGP